MFFGLLLIYLMIGCAVLLKVLKNMRIYQGKEFKKELWPVIIFTYLTTWPVMLYIGFISIHGKKETRDAFNDIEKDTISSMTEDIE